MRIVLTAVLLLQALNVYSQELSASDLDRRRKVLRDLVDEQWEYQLRTNPEYASYLGDKRYNDKSSDASEAGARADIAAARRFLRRFQAIDPTAFSEQEILNRQLMVRNLRESIEEFELGEWKMPVTQMSGIHLNRAQFPSFLTFTNAKDFDDFAQRIRDTPKMLEDTIARMRKGMRDRVMPPRFLLEKVAMQAEEIGRLEPEASPYAVPLLTVPDSIAPAERERIRRAYLDLVRTKINPAYLAFARFVREEYAPAGRRDPGVWSLPDGAKRYAFRIRQSTTTSTLTATEIHRIGLAEVARIESDMLAIAKRLGFADLKTFNAAIEKNAGLRAKSGDGILTLYRKYIDQMYARLPQLFGRLPKASVVVKEVEAYRAKAAAGAEYNVPAPDGSRPGIVMVNTLDPSSRKTISMESTAYHEGVPGHHMQIAIAQELTGIPMFRREGGYTAFVEGWALYSEALGKEAGFYQDPYNDYGRLQDEMLRAIRLVVDTGLHAKRWTREQVVQFFHDHSALDEVDVQVETDRYIVWPGQALGYKIGQLKIAELRERAQRELGERFDIRSFHDEVLGAGAVPLDVLEQRIASWIEARRR